MKKYFQIWNHIRVIRRLSSSNTFVAFLNKSVFEQIEWMIRLTHNTWEVTCWPSTGVAIYEDIQTTYEEDTGLSKLVTK